MDPNDQSEPGPVKSHIGMSPAEILEDSGNNPSIVDHLIQSSEASLPALKHIIQSKLSNNRLKEPALFISEKRGQRLTRRSEEIAKEANVRANYTRVNIEKMRKIVTSNPLELT